MKFVTTWSFQFMKLSMVSLPRRISEQIIGNLGAIADWYIEERFSYIRVFGCFTSPHSLPRFLPDRLVCREVAYQTVSGGITKELKATQKRVWPTFPIEVGIFSLSDFGHAKVEASTLEDIKLVDIEYKRHDPHRVVEIHLDQFNMKRYIHPMTKFSEELDHMMRLYPYFKVFLKNNSQASSAFKSTEGTIYPKSCRKNKDLIQLHRWQNQQSSNNITFPKTKLGKWKRYQKHCPRMEIITGISIPGKSDQELLTSFEAFMKHGHNFPLSLSNTETPVKDTTNQGESTALISPIPSLTPLETSFDLPCSEVINIDA
jgi:hypothetical protein